MAQAMLLILQAAAAAAGVQEAPDGPAGPAPVTGPVLPAPPARKKPSLDIAQAARECRADQGDAIVVCAERDDARYRLHPLPDPGEERSALPRAETTLFGDAKASADLESETLQQGLVSKRLMLRFTLPF